MNKYDFTGLNNLFPKLPWHELWVTFHPTRSNRGLKPEFTWEMMIKSVLVQWHVEIVSDIDFATWLSQNENIIELCGMHRAPSHDVISKFTREHGHNFQVLHAWFDKQLEEFGIFVDDNIAGDGTHVLLHKPQDKADADCFGAKSNNHKFYGLWLMLLVSVKTGLVRAFNYDKARIGQINLMFQLLTSGFIQTKVMYFLDGIFDVKDIHVAIMFEQESIPMIAYNKKGSQYETRKDLPLDDWRLEYNPFFKDGLWMIIESSKRTTVERSNSLLKMNTTLKDVYERSRRLQKRSKNHIHKLIIGSIVKPQLQKLAELHMPKIKTLIEYIQQENKIEVTA